MMQNAFLVTRLVFFALIFNLNLLILAFASWNIHASTSSGITGSTVSGFLLFNSCLSFICVAFGLLECLFRFAPASRVVVECVWTATLSLLQVGSAIGLTVNAAALVGESKMGLDVVVSTFLLVPTAWISSVIFLSYFFALFISGVAHMRAMPNIWFMSVTSVGWFTDGSPDLVFEKGSIYPTSKSHQVTDTWARHVADIESGAIQTKQSSPPTWAKTQNIRRGIDAPFSSQPTSSAVTSPRSGTSSLPTRPLKVQGKQESRNGSRFVERIRESGLFSWRISAVDEMPSRVSAFPPTIDDHDLPIPLPRLSEWIRADTIKGINVHTVPHA